LSSPSETQAIQQTKKPCKHCDEKAEGARIPQAFLNVVKANRFTESVMQIVRESGFQIASGSLDPVTALLVLRRRVGFIAEQFEGCGVCRRDIVMSEEFDQYMIDAKQARLTWVGKRRWQALKMYARFQVNIVRGIFKWVPENKWLVLFAALGITALIEHFLRLL